MKICVVTTWPPHLDGVSFYSAHLYEHIGKNVKVKVLANITNPVEEDFTQRSCKIIRCWKRGSITYPLKIFDEALVERPDIIHLQHGWLLYGGNIAPLLFPALLLLLRLTKRPLVVTMHTIIGENPKLHKNAIVNFIARITIMLLTRAIVKFSSIVIVHNNLMKETLRNLYSLYKEDWKIAVIPHGVREGPEEPKEILKSEGEKILSLGFIRRMKGIEYLIEAFKMFSTAHPEFTLVIVGGKHAHDDEEYIKSLKKKLSNGIRNIVFTGFVDEETLDKLIWESRIVVLPSLGSYYIEASGALARVAMYGKPIICSKVPKFMADLEDGENCIMVEFDNPRKLAEKLILLAENEDLRKRIGGNLKSKFKNRVWDKVAEQHINLFKDILGFKPNKTC